MKACLFANLGGLWASRQKGGLKDILGILLVMQQAATDSENHGTMAFQQLCESVLICAGEERLNQLPVGQIGERLAQWSCAGRG